MSWRFKLNAAFERARIADAACAQYMGLHELRFNSGKRYCHCNNFPARTSARGSLKFVRIMPLAMRNLSFYTKCMLGMCAAPRYAGFW
jgi:hypothetical protein